MKTDLFQSCGHCWVFQICWYIECSTFTASSFRIWNSSMGIPSPPLALFIVMLPKAHLTLHSRMSGSRWVVSPSWLSGSWRSFLYSSSVYPHHLFLIFSASVKFIPFLTFIEPIFPQFVVIHTVKGFSAVSKAEVDVISGTLLLSPWPNKWWQPDLWFLCLFKTQLAYLEVFSACTAEA